MSTGLATFKFDVRVKREVADQVIREIFEEDDEIINFDEVSQYLDYVYGLALFDSESVANFSAAYDFAREEPSSLSVKAREYIHNKIRIHCEDHPDGI